jgi:hypothetical protein
MPYLEGLRAVSAAPNLSIARSTILALTRTCRPVPCGSVSICCLQAGQAGPESAKQAENLVAVL